LDGANIPAREQGRLPAILRQQVTCGHGKCARHLGAKEIPLQVPANRLHLVSVDKQGVARLKLRPRFERDSERGVVRVADL
jgi:hypothetical protein